jgi:hypothetical protein
MPTSYSPTIGIALLATGEDAGTWGTLTNTNLSPILESAICGYSVANFGTDSDLTLTITNGTDSVGRYHALSATSSVALTATRNLFVPLNGGKTYVIANNTSGSQSIVVKGSSGTGVTIPNGYTVIVYTDGANYFTQMNVTSGNFYVQGNLGIGRSPTNVLDISQVTNGTAVAQISNTSSGNNATAEWAAVNGTDATALIQVGTNYTASGAPYIAHGGLLRSTGVGGLTLSSDSGPINFYANTNSTFGPVNWLQVNAGSLSMPGITVNANTGSFPSIVTTGFGITTTTSPAGISTVNGSGYMIVNNTLGVSLPINGNAWIGLSDERDKDIIESIMDAVRKCSQLRPVIGKYKADRFDARRSFLIAQDVQKVLPEAVHVNGEDRLMLCYQDLIPLLVAAVNELSSEVKALKARGV